MVDWVQVSKAVDAEIARRDMVLNTPPGRQNTLWTHAGNPPIHPYWTKDLINNIYGDTAYVSYINFYLAIDTTEHHKQLVKTQEFHNRLAVSNWI
jgi:hypothetical protein